MSVGIKLGINVFALAMIPFITVCLIAVFYSQANTRKEIVSRLDSDLKWQKRFIENQISMLADKARESSFYNTSTQGLTKKLIRYPEKDNFVRNLELKNAFPYLQQYLQGDINRMFIIANYMEDEESMVGRVLFSARQVEKEGQLDVVEDTFDIENKRQNGLQVTREVNDPISKAYFKGRNKKSVTVHDFAYFEGEYSYFISTPILKSKQMIYILPFVNDEVAEKVAKEIKGEYIGMVLFQITPKAFEEILGPYNDIGETFMVGKTSDKKLILHSDVGMISTDSGDALVKGHRVPTYLDSVLDSTGLMNRDNRYYVADSLTVEGVSFYLMAVIESDKIFAPVRKMAIVFIAVGVIGLIPISLSVFYLARHFARPLRQLATILTQTREKGDLSMRSEVRSKDEIGTAVSEVNRLMDSFQIALNEISDVMSAVAQGDLRKHVNAEFQGDLNDLKNHVNYSIEILQKTVADVISTTIKVQSGVNVISDSAANLSNATTEQAASLEEISSSLNEIERQTKDNNEKAKSVSLITGETREFVQNGNKQMEEMLESMGSINETSRDVTKVINTIEEIAFQTNLLALNAAVEAARAGTHGKGFAVVAEEVRNLAGRSSNAAKNTTDLIENSIKEVENGLKLSNQTAEIFQQIVGKIGSVNEMVGDIAAISQQQKEAVEEINNGLSQVNNGVQENSSIAQQLANATQNLTSQAQIQKERIEYFKVNEEGHQPLLPESNEPIRKVEDRRT